MIFCHVCRQKPVQPAKPWTAPAWTYSMACGNRRQSWARLPAGHTDQKSSRRECQVQDPPEKSRHKKKRHSCTAMGASVCSHIKYKNPPQIGQRVTKKANKNRIKPTQTGAPFHNESAVGPYLPSGLPKSSSDSCPSQPDKSWPASGSPAASNQFRPVA